MPVTNIQKKSELDKFYTNPVIALSCIQRLNRFIKDKDLNFVEPSAGSGSFSFHIPNCMAFDIAPEASGIVQNDFLTQTLELTKNTCIIGNPPFGSKNDLSKAFIRKACSYPWVRIIAFVLPESFNKLSMQKVFTDRWHLIDATPLPKDSFLLEGVPYHVPCVFQIWVRDDFIELPDLREVSYGNSCSDFMFVADINRADVFMFGAAPNTIVDVDHVLPTNRGYFLKSFIDKDELCVKLRSVDWKSVASSSVTGGVAWFSKDEILKHYRIKQ